MKQSLNKHNSSFTSPATFLPSPQHSPDTENKVANDAGGVPDQEHSAVPLPHEQVRGILPWHLPKVPAAEDERS